jgi:ADP-ribosylation factor protein 4
MFSRTRVQAIIFVVDSNDSQRFEEARRELEVVMGEEMLKDAALLVLANKQDISRAAPVVHVADELHIRELARNRKWFIQGYTSPALPP